MDVLAPKTDEQIAADVEALKPAAPRLTAELVQLAIDDEMFTQIEGTSVIVCTLTMRNGHKVVGVAPGPVSAANFDAQIGCGIAYKKAVAQAWALEAYLLSQRLSDVAENPPHEGATHVANPIYVTARQIEIVTGCPESDYAVWLVGMEEGITLKGSQCGAHVPRVGDWVNQTDAADVYLIPCEVFERKYRPV